MPKQKKINPARATPQAPRGLRVATRARAEAPPAEAPGKTQESDDEEDEDEELDDDKPDQEAHDAAMVRASDAHRAAAEAAEAAKGTDSASTLMAYEDAHAEAMEAGDAARTSCISMRGGAADEEAPADSQPTPVAPTAQAIARAAAAPTAAAHLEVAAYAKLGRDVMQLLGAKSADAAMLKVEAGRTALAQNAGYREKDRKVAAAASLTARAAVLHDAVAQGVIKGRAAAFMIEKDGKLGAPLPTWMRGTVAELTETLVTLGYKPGAPPDARAALVVAGGDEATDLAVRAAQAGVDVETYKLAQANRRNDR